MRSGSCRLPTPNMRGEEGEEESEKGQRERKAAFVFTPQSDVGVEVGRQDCIFCSLCEQRCGNLI